MVAALALAAVAQTEPPTITVTPPEQHPEIGESFELNITTTQPVNITLTWNTTVIQQTYIAEDNITATLTPDAPLTVHFTAFNNMTSDITLAANTSATYIVPYITLFNSIQTPQNATVTESEPET